MRYETPTCGTNDLRVTLLPNPSHLGTYAYTPPHIHSTQNRSEAIDPVALGYARGLQSVLLKQLLSDSKSGGDIGCTLGDKVLCVQMHGDASFTGQGVVMESLGLSELWYILLYSEPRTDIISCE